MVFAQPVDLTRKVHGVEHCEEFVIEAILRPFGQFSGLDPEAGLKGLGIFTAEFAQVPATLPGPPADLQEELSY